VPSTATSPQEPSVASTPASAGSSSRLSEEIAILDQAKLALKKGDPAEALRQLDAYRRAFNNGTMDDAATALRVEALVRSGRREEARAELSALQASHPGSPLLDNLRRMIGGGSHE
jgi:hypothetical protein